LCEECTAYIIDTNVILSALIKSGKTRKCLKTCNTQYYIPNTVIDEVLKVKMQKDFKKIIKKMKRKINERKIALEDIVTVFVAEIFDIATLFLNIQPIHEKPRKRDLKQAEEIIGARDPSDIPIIAIALYLARKHRQEKICIWTYDNDILNVLREKNEVIKAVKKPCCCK